jgi:predicted transcriptional regulator
VAAQSRQAAQALRGAGLSNTDIAHLLGVSDQRVSQLFGKTGTKS